MPDQHVALEALHHQLRRQGLRVEPERFAAFAQAHQHLLVFTEQLRQRSLVSVKQLDVGDDN